MIKGIKFATEGRVMFQDKSKYYQEHKEIIKSQSHNRWRYLPPWEKTWAHMRARCSNTRLSYFKKGIQALISKNELKELWFRDEAYALEKPSIDRIDNDGDYTFENCRYIEFSENVRRNNVCRQV